MWFSRKANCLFKVDGNKSQYSDNQGETWYFNYRSIEEWKEMHKDMVEVDLIQLQACYNCVEFPSSPQVVSLGNFLIFKNESEDEYIYRLKLLFLLKVKNITLTGDVVFFDGTDHSQSPDTSTNLAMVRTVHIVKKDVEKHPVPC